MNSIIGPPGQSSVLGPLLTQTLTGKKLLMSIKLNIYLLYWYFQQNQCLNIKKYAVYIIHRSARWPYARGALGNCPACPCAKMALGGSTSLMMHRHDKNNYFMSLWSIYIKRVRFMVFNATFNNISVISWWSALLVEETRVPGENHWFIQLRIPENFQFAHFKGKWPTGFSQSGSICNKSNLY